MPKISSIEEKLRGRSVHLPVSYWERLEKMKETDRSLTPSRVIREAIRRRLEPDSSYDQEGVILPLAMFIPCGEPETLEALTQPFGDETRITVRGPLVALVTKNSFIGIARGSSMECHGLENISNGDRLLMIPREEMKREIAPGALVLTKITYHHSAEPRITLKKFVDLGKLKANNLKHKAPEPDDDIESFEAMAVCVGVLEKSFV